MYAEMDEYLVHQIPATLDELRDPDPNWNQGFYFNIWSEEGSFMLGTELIQVPNQGIINAYAKVHYERKHHNVNARREINNDRHVAKVGPFSYEVLEPLKKWRVKLEPNESGISYDVTWTANRKTAELLPHVIKVGNRVRMDHRCVMTLGTWEGRVQLGSQTVDVTGYQGMRNREWGIRDLVAAGDFFSFHQWNMQSYAVYGWIWEDYLGDPIPTCTGSSIHMYDDGRVDGPYIRWDHKIEFEGKTKLLKGGRVLMRDVNGKTKEFEIIRRRASLLFGPMLRADRTQPFTYETWDMNDPEEMAAVQRGAVAADNLVDFRCLTDGETGTGNLELWVAGRGYKPYAANWPYPPPPQ